MESGTSKILTDCVRLLSTKSYESYPQNTQHPAAKFASHPDIKYFRSIKDENHFEYHRTKNGIRNTQTRKVPEMMGKVLGESVARNQTVFNPHDRTLLLQRISSFTALNWRIPNLKIASLTQLLCAQNGWKCTRKKNTIECTYCHAQLQLKFNDESEPTEDINSHTYLPFDFDEEDYQALNSALAEEYCKQISKSAHDSNCLWRTYTTPLEGVYYPTPHLEDTDAFMVDDYLSNLKELVDNVDLLTTYGSNSLNTKSLSDILPESFKLKSNELLSERYYKENQENHQLSVIPGWIYLTASLGWNLHVQTFAGQVVLLLICSKCNGRVYMDTSSTPTHCSDNVNCENVSSSNILTPCEYPPLLPEQPSSIYDMDDSDSLKVDLFDEHKPWCSHLHCMDGKTVQEYLIEIITERSSSEIKQDTKRKANFDINEGLDRLHKLRKLYL
ncbi:hypothetical protein CAAN1_03S02564 [[Candida] anglica]|uniref:C3HC-type domain-containing protein n=1 Tax=[Candida] anglica TaxID=148631 RepID=A0ABP0EGT1_9ASCO